MTATAEAPTINLELTWTSQNGRVTKFEDINDAHLANILRMLQRDGRFHAYRLMRAEMSRRSQELSEEDLHGMAVAFLLNADHDSIKVTFQ